MSDLTTGANTGTTTATLRVTVNFFALALIYYLFPPKIRIDEGEWQKLSRGENAVPVPPGRHQVTVMAKVYWILPVGQASIEVSAPAGGTLSLHYKAPWLVFPGIGGKLTQA